MSFLATRFGATSLQVVSLRAGGHETTRRARVHVATLPEQGPLKAVGWERNDKGQLGPKMVDLSATMDPVRCVGRLPPVWSGSRPAR